MKKFDWSPIARRLNPWREDGTAMMRGIIHGFASPGKPWIAAEMAWRDTRSSYCANGLYGAMFAAAMASAAFYESDPITLIETGIAEIPSSSQLARLAKRILVLGKSNPEWSSALQALDKEIEEPLGSHIAGSAVSVLLGLILWTRQLWRFHIDCRQRRRAYIGQRRGDRGHPRSRPGSQIPSRKMEHPPS